MFGNVFVETAVILARAPVLFLILGFADSFRFVDSFRADLLTQSQSLVPIFPFSRESQCYFSIFSFSSERPALVVADNIRR